MECQFVCISAYTLIPKMINSHQYRLRIMMIFMFHHFDNDASSASIYFDGLQQISVIILHAGYIYA